MPENELIVSKEYGIGHLSELALAIRKTVFVNEQKVSLELELDDFDDATTHYIGFISDRATTTARVHIMDTGNWHVQRVATLPEERGKGYSSVIMNAIIDDAKEAGAPQIELSAQLERRSFYEKFGFKAVGDTFMDAGIEHIEMILPLK